MLVILRSFFVMFLEKLWYKYSFKGHLLILEPGKRSQMYSIPPVPLNLL